MVICREDGHMAQLARQASVSDAEWPCHLCHAVRCQSNKGKGHQKWVQCDRCLMWQHHDCAGLNRKPRGHWFCAECEAPSNRKLDEI